MRALGNASAEPQFGSLRRDGINLLSIQIEQDQQLNARVFQESKRFEFGSPQIRRLLSGVELSEILTSMGMSLSLFQMHYAPCLLNTRAPCSQSAAHNLLFSRTAHLPLPSLPVSSGPPKVLFWFASPHAGSLFPAVKSGAPPTFSPVWVGCLPGSGGSRRMSCCRRRAVRSVKEVALLYMRRGQLVQFWRFHTHHGRQSVMLLHRRADKHVLCLCNLGR